MLYHLFKDQIEKIKPILFLIFSKQINLGDFREPFSFFQFNSLLQYYHHAFFSPETGSHNLLPNFTFNSTALHDI